MSTLLVAAILVGIVAAVILLLVSLDKTQKRKSMNQLLHAFHQKGSEHHLTFSSQELLKSTIIGLDGLHRKLLVLEQWEEGAFSTLLIDLKDVKSCSLKKEYGTINGGDLKAKKLEHFLRTMTLQFVLYGKSPVEVVFYNHLDQHISEMADLENKARHWEAVLSKMIVPLKKSA